MATDYNEQLENSIASECKLTLASGRVANFAYNDTAYACDNVAGTANYNFSQDQNIPLGNAGVLNTTTDILAKGVRSQASSLTRMMLNHFYGRTSYNVNKLADHLLSLFRTVKNFIKENDTTWSATTEYDVGDLVYFVTTLNGKKYKRTFFCIQSCLNLPPIDSNTESVINTSYWSEISGNVVSLSASESIRAKQGIIEQDLVVHGNLFVDGNTTTTTETQVASTGDYLVTRENNPSPMSSGEFSGLAVNNYDTGKMATLTADHCGEWRVSDSATVSAVTYTDISTYEGTFYDGLTRTALTSYPSHVFVNVSMLEMLDVVYYNGGYYKKEGNSWYGTVTYSNGALNKGSLITDSEIITALEALTPSSLIYYITVTDNIIDSSSNQPLLTRAESTCFNNGDLLMWDSANRTAVKVPSPTCDNQKLTARIDSVTGCLSYTWTDASSTDNATCFAGCTYACAKADFRNYTPLNACNACCALWTKSVLPTYQFAKNRVSGDIACVNNNQYFSMKWHCCSKICDLYYVLCCLVHDSIFAGSNNVYINVMSVSSANQLSAFCICTNSFIFKNANNTQIAKLINTCTDIIGFYGQITFASASTV